MTKEETDIGIRESEYPKLKSREVSAMLPDWRASNQTRQKQEGRGLQKETSRK